MRKIKFEEYNKKRKKAKIKLLKLRDKLDRKPGGGQRIRDREKRSLLYKLAREKKERLLEKIGDRKYRFKE